jgi:hypothetical protein
MPLTLGWRIDATRRFRGGAVSLDRTKIVALKPADKKIALASQYVAKNRSASGRHHDLIRARADSMIRFRESHRLASFAAVAACLQFTGDLRAVYAASVKE